MERGRSRPCCLSVRFEAPLQSVIQPRAAQFLTLNGSDQIEPISMGPASFEYVVGKCHERVGEPQQPKVIGCPEI